MPTHHVLGLLVSRKFKCIICVFYRCSFFLLQLTSCYGTIGRIYLSACLLSRGLLRGIEEAYMKAAFDFDTAAMAVFSTCTVHVIFFHSLPPQVGCSFQGKLFSIFKLLCVVFVRYYLSSRSALENCILFVIALRFS